mmetsp:Transcript_30807/g.50880  ORF Transcript_30807/g.50880 Transcript_30807/m.50880 type:complete len:481 (-) Transcript_30807:62-1504(-)
MKPCSTASRRRQERKLSQSVTVLLLSILFLLMCLPTVATESNNVLNVEELQDDPEDHLQEEPLVDSDDHNKKAAQQQQVVKDDPPPDESLFNPSSLYTVLGPTRFPKPTDKIEGENAQIVLEPTFGTHRPDHDAVMAYAEGYELVHYLQFVETLLATGFEGDIVLATSALDDLRDGVEDYLRSCTACVVYATDFTCSDNNFDTTSERMQDNGGRMSFQMCRLDHIYGVANPVTGILEAVPDPRTGRVVATSRYELYWIWASQYDSHAWLMLLDARDAYFQTNPFTDLPRTTESSSKKDGLLYFFGENTANTRLGKSPKNRKWLERGYSVGIMKFLSDKPTICSGSTMGETIAVEAYLRAMVNEWDETLVLQKGTDQAFHNYLYYSNKLQNVKEIRSVTVFDQGKGIINNLGALRDLKLVDLGVYKVEERLVYNWDGSVSPVVHQWDRDKLLFHYISDKVFPATKTAWEEKKKKTLVQKSS